jgi:hypothetical protein
VNNVDVSKWAPEWADTDEKWLLVEEALDEAGNEFNVTDNEVAMIWMVDKVEEKFLSFILYDDARLLSIIRLRDSSLI